MDSRYRERLDRSFSSFHRAALGAVLRSGLRNPRSIPVFLRAAFDNRRFSRMRASRAARGLTVPPVLIASVTGKCNLACAGCYHRALHRDVQAELPAARFAELLREAEGLGIGIALLAGGEPFARADFFGITGGSRRMILPVFTNGLLIDDGLARKIAGRPNLVPVISVEGGSDLTDARRGAGTHSGVLRAVAALRKRGVLYGHSITVTRENMGEVTSSAFAKRLFRGGAAFLVYVEYVPVKEGTENLLLGESGRAGLRKALGVLRREVRAPVVAFPGEEEAFGGCLAAGRGFIHINPRGGLEPCPFAPFSDVNLADSSLADALASPFLSRVREGHAALTENGGCALWANRDWAEGLLAR